MDKEQVVERTFSPEQLTGMSVNDIAKLIGHPEVTTLEGLAKIPGIEFHGTGVVRKADGTIRYDADAKPGSFHESAADLAAVNA